MNLLEEGDYPAIWCAYIVTVKTEYATYELSTKMGIRGMKDVTATFKDGDWSVTEKAGLKTYPVEITNVTIK